ncbi:hypothetical protein CZ787_11700 [Halomonas citrativorans]|uniref:Uncharacterized protein n=1 Tax=Halomonas citrativorans TaxID=2742612 RepID=A0A1R4I1K0_9GAMM|nr:hypothetical protein CZ787_11700 [Halomonas citrativorans]
MCHVERLKTSSINIITGAPFGALFYTQNKAKSVLMLMINIVIY